RPPHRRDRARRPADGRQLSPQRRQGRTPAPRRGFLLSCVPCSWLPVSMNPLSWSFREQFLLGATVSFGMIIAAITIGGVLGLEACPLCIFQRVAFGILGVAFLVGAMVAPRGSTGRGIWGLVAFAAAGTGIGIAGRHVWLQ